MVDDAGQLYTIEGIAAAILLLVTIYLVLGTTTIYTPGDSHISDLQLEQLGNDALAMMDTSTQYVEPVPPAPLDLYIAKQSDLEKYIMTPDVTGFNQTLSDYLNVKNTTRDHLNYNAIVWYRNAGSNSLGSYQFYPSSPTMTGREHFVRVTRLVTLSGRPPPPAPNPGMDDRLQTVLLDVTIWRD